MGRPEMNMLQNYFRPAEALCAEPLHYTECGLDNIYLKNGFRLYREDDGEESLSISDVDGLHRAIGLHIVLEKKAPSPKEMRFLRDELDMSQAELARILGVSDQSVARWEKGHCEANGGAVFALRMIYLLSLLPQEEREKVMATILERLRRLSEMDETNDSIVLTYNGRWYDPVKVAA